MTPFPCLPDFELLLFGFVFYFCQTMIKHYFQTDTISGMFEMKQSSLCGITELFTKKDNGLYQTFFLGWLLITLCILVAIIKVCFQQKPFWQTISKSVQDYLRLNKVLLSKFN